MYEITLILHSLLRWIVVSLAVVALFRGATGGSKPWDSADEVGRRWLPHALSLQLVIGLVLYGVLSPITTGAFGNMGAAMKNPAIRFYAVEHITVMLIALTLTHIGAARTRRATDPAAKRKTMLLFFGIATLLMVWGIPWGSRPLFRLG